jgi:hypothetical protein
MKPNWGLKKNITEWLSMPMRRYVKNGVYMDVKFEHDSDNGWAVCGNDWSNVFRGLEFPMSYGQLVSEGWKEVD